MKQDKHEVLTHLCTNVSQSVELFAELLAVSEDAVPKEIRTKALMRRLRICFIGLYEFLSEKAELPQEFRQKSLDEIVDFFISKQMLTADDKDDFVMLGSVYTAIRWTKPGSAPDENKIVEHVDKLHAFLAKTVSYHTSLIASEPTKEATL